MTEARWLGHPYKPQNITINACGVKGCGASWSAHGPRPAESAEPKCKACERPNVDDPDTPHTCAPTPAPLKDVREAWAILLPDGTFYTLDMEARRPFIFKHYMEPGQGKMVRVRLTVEEL